MELDREPFGPLMVRMSVTKFTLVIVAFYFFSFSLGAYLGHSLNPCREHIGANRE